MKKPIGASRNMRSVSSGVIWYGADAGADRFMIDVRIGMVWGACRLRKYYKADLNAADNRRETYLSSAQGATFRHAAR